MQKLEKEAEDLEEKISVVEGELNQMKEENGKKRLEKMAYIKKIKESLDQISSINLEIKRYYQIYIYIIYYL